MTIYDNLELPSCIANDNDLSPVDREILDAMYAWLTARIENGDPVPLPKEG